MSPLKKKRSLGQFYTTGNPFVLPAFRRWLDAAGPRPDEKILEPFAGANHLVRLMREAGYSLPWSCFDIAPSASAAEGFSIERRDCLKRFPKGFRLAITNPPYLARNSATRRRLSFPDTPHDDLYKHAVAICLKNVEYLAAIIPESFLTSGDLTGRLEAVVSLSFPMFDDTEHPVCLALFSPKQSQDFEIFLGDEHIGTHSAVAGFLPPPRRIHPWRFNDPEGSIGLRAVDNHSVPSIAFVRGESIPPGRVKQSSRALTRIAGLPGSVPQDAFLAAANALLKDYRSHTRDVLMTPFKGLRADGYYRRRLDFSTARHLMDLALDSLPGS